MNAPASQSAIGAPISMTLPIASIVPSKTHIQELRRARFDKKLLEELASSIRQVGVLQPIVVRPRGSERHELVAGERRWLAAKIAGLAEISASVADLSDEQVLEVQLIENLQREGLHELEEAEGYEELMKLKKINADVVADMVGRSRSYVFKRTKLLALCKEARQAFYGGALDASRALLIARIGHHDTQREALKYVTKGRHPNDGPMSFRDAQKFILDHYMLRLQQAPFDIKDEQLVAKAGSCVKCPKRTGNQRDLFGDVKDGNLCTDAKCFDDKRQAHHAGARKALEAKGEKVIHGDAAKKIVPNWEESKDTECSNGYVALDEHSYELGGKVRDHLPPEYKPVLIQHPLTGKIFEAATKQALTKGKLQKKHGKTASAPKVKQPSQPDLDEVLTERLAQLIHKAAPKQFGKAWLLDLAKVVLDKLNLRDEDAIAKAFGWPASAFRRGGYSNGVPAQAAKLDERGLVLLMFQIVFATRWGRESVLKLFGINEQKTRELIIEERKAAARAAREAAASDIVHAIQLRGALNRKINRMERQRAEHA
jgi:ParB/RepB/Spo0J family partition protein